MMNRPAFAGLLLLALTTSVMGADPIACSKDSSTRDMVHHVIRGGSTVQECIDRCFDGNFKFAGLQYGGHCFCDDTYGDQGDATNCDMDCGGECGGSWANSVYETGATGYLPPENRVGCFQDQSNPRDMANHVIKGGAKVQQCIDLCASSNYKYAGLQYGGHCFCDDTYGSLGTSINCNMHCDGECGGSWANTVYETGKTGHVEPPKPADWLGCYKDSSTRDMKNHLIKGGGTVAECKATCLEKNYKYAGAQYGGHCFCDDTYGSQGEATNCDMDCEGECGGSWANTVYETGGTGFVPPPKPEGWLGCYKDSSTRDMTRHLIRGGSTVDECKAACLELNYKYAGAQYGGHCFCDDTYGSQGEATNCDMECGGECGGSWANSVYETGGTGFVPPPKPEGWIGCYKDSATRDMKKHLIKGGSTVDECKAACLDLNYKYAGAQFGGHCFCDDTYGEQGTADNCNMECGGECGGSWANSVYETGGTGYVPPPPPPRPENWMGCYRDSSNRDMQLHLVKGGSSVPSCTTKCGALGYLYAGLQFGGHCFCDNTYGAQGEADNCDMLCTGECGGSWANSVYKTEGDGNVRFSRLEAGSNCIATGWGDPHIVTFDKLKFDVHALGELIFLTSQNTNFEIQARTQGIKSSDKVAVTTGVVVKEADDDLPMVQISLSKPDSPFAKQSGPSACNVQMYVDRIATDWNADLGEDVHVQHFGKLIMVEYPTTNMRLDIEVKYWRETCYLSIDYVLLDCRPDDDLIGILGSPDGNKNNDWMDRNGTPLSIPNGVGAFFFEPAYNYAVENWCIRDPERSNFAYEGDLDFYDYAKCGNAYDPTLEDLITEALVDPDDEVTQNCDGNLGCMVEGELMGTEAAELFLNDPAETLPEVPDETVEEPEIVLAVSETAPGDCPVCKAVGWGDPHIITFDGLSYDVHVKGELTFLKSTDPQNDFTIQARTAVVSGHPKGPAVTTGVLVYGNGEDTIQVSMGADADSDLANMFGVCPVQLYVNGVAENIKGGDALPLNGATVQVNGNRIVVENINLQVRLDMTVKVWRNACHFSVVYYLADCPCDGSLVGILGQPGGGWPNDWHEHDGTPVEIPSSRRKRRGKEAYDYSLTWCLTDADSHFTYETGMGHGDHDFCTDSTTAEENFPDIDEIIDEIKETKPAVIETCTFEGETEPDEGCLIDCALLGDEACDEFVEIIENTETATITPYPTSGPTSGPTSAPTKEPALEPNPGPNEPVEDNSPGPSGSHGDPHFKSWIGEHFEFHGQCDLVLVQDAKFADGLGIDVQIRTKLVRYWSYIKRVAIRIGEDILEVEGSADEENNNAIYWSNFEYQPIEQPKQIGGFPLEMKVGKANSHKHHFVIDLSSKYPGVKIAIDTFKEFIKVDFINGSEEAFGNAVGMMGNFHTGKTVGRDGSTVINDFNEFGNEWQVRPSDNMVFHDTSDPQFPKRCVLPEDPQGQRRRRLEESSVSIEDAEKACARLTDELDRKECVYDIVATQDLEMAGAY